MFNVLYNPQGPRENNQIPAIEAYEGLSNGGAFASGDVPDAEMGSGVVQST